MPARVAAAWIRPSTAVRSSRTTRRSSSSGSTENRRSPASYAMGILRRRLKPVECKAPRPLQQIATHTRSAASHPERHRDEGVGRPRWKYLAGPAVTVALVLSGLLGL